QLACVPAHLVCGRHDRRERRTYVPPYIEAVKATEQQVLRYPDSFRFAGLEYSDGHGVGGCNDRIRSHLGELLLHDVLYIIELLRVSHDSGYFYLARRLLAHRSEAFLALLYRMPFEDRADEENRAHSLFQQMIA